jgi:hypothetical protein
MSTLESLAKQFDYTKDEYFPLLPDSLDNDILGFDRPLPFSTNVWIALGHLFVLAWFQIMDSPRDSTSKCKVDPEMWK